MALATSRPINEEITELKHRVSRLEKGNGSLKINDVIAKEMIISYIKNKKKRRITKISLLDFTLDLNLPASQVERIMDTLEGKLVKNA